MENFIIRFMTADVRDKWTTAVEKQRRILSKHSRDQNANSTSQTEFTYMSGTVLQNPYEQEEDYDDDDNIRISSASTLVSTPSDYPVSGNASTTSLRSRSTTGGSGPPGNGGMSRVAPPRFPLLEHSLVPPLKVSTSFSNGALTPEERGGNSYFSPGGGESPSSLRSTSQMGMYPFSRQQTQPGNAWPADGNKHNTAPPMGRAPLREDENANGYASNGRNLQRPSLPPMAVSHIQSSNSQHILLAQSRSRSLSSPDMHNGQGPGAGKRFQNGQMQMGPDDVPVPPIPAHMASMRAPINRSQNNSPTDSLRAARAGSQSTNLQRGPSTYVGGYMPQEPTQVRPDGRQFYGPGPTPSGHSQRMFSQAIPSASPQEEISLPSQLKVKVYFEPKPSHVTIVVPVIIKHRSLIDRIDSKMERVTVSSIARGSARLRYYDSDGDLITIANDDDVENAVEEWKAKHYEQLTSDGPAPDFELYWHEVAPGSTRLM